MSMIDALSDLLWRYLDMYDGNPLDEVYDMHEVAAYLGIGYDMMKTYVSRKKVLCGKQIGRSMVFTRAQLDRFNQRERKRKGHPGGD